MEYHARIKCNPLATKGKLADVSDNLRSSRMQRLPKKTQVRLMRKYRRALRVLQDGKVVIFLKCRIKSDECRMDNMCCNFCIKNRNGCDGCDY